jgi:hypothetical protein
MRDFLHEGGYAPTNVINEYPFACLNADRTMQNVIASVAAFAESPHTMRTACIGAYEVDRAEEIPNVLGRARYLTAPIAIIKAPEKVHLFSVRTVVDSTPLETATPDNFDTKFKSRIADFSPTKIFEIKQSSRHNEMFDVGLWPWAEDITSETLANLLEALIVEARNAIPESYRRRPAADSAILKLIFHLFACRVLQDKNLIKQNDDPRIALQNAHDNFSDNIDPDVAESPYISRSSVKNIFDKLRTRFAFSSLTSDMLGSAYENALVSP